MSRRGSTSTAPSATRSWRAARSCSTCTTTSRGCSRSCGVSYLLANHKCVVSETGADRAIEQQFEPGIAFAPYDKLAETCMRLLQNPSRAPRNRRGGLRAHQIHAAGRLSAPGAGHSAAVKPLLTSPRRPGPPRRLRALLLDRGRELRRVARPHGRAGGFSRSATAGSLPNLRARRRRSARRLSGSRAQPHRSR